MVLAVMTNDLFYVYMLNAVQGTRQREPIDLSFLQISFGSPGKVFGLVQVDNIPYILGISVVLNRRPRSLFSV